MNQETHMSRSDSTVVRPSTWRQRLGALAIGCAATLLAAPGAAVTIPDLPLQTGTAYPPANIMFILDDSGSMDFDFMPGANSVNELPAVAPVNIAPLAYPRNTLYYNPSTNYRPWVRADGSRYAATPYTSAFSDPSGLATPVNLANSTRTFYVPRLRDGATDMSSTASYYRFQILAGGTQIERSEYGAAVVGTSNFAGFPVTGLTRNAGNWVYYTINVPQEANSITIATSGGGGSGQTRADLYVKFGANPTLSDYECRSRNNGNNETCTITGAALQPGIWHIGVYAESNFSNVRVDAAYSANNRCDGGTGGGNTWINCTMATPDVQPVPPSTTWTNRSVSDELQNYANWYSFHRTRMKVAKAGASEAFDLVGTNLRVGYDSIWNRASGTGSSVSTSATPVYPIPVGTDGGLFRGSNRTQWFQYLHSALGDNGTPLKGALQRAGRYFESSSSTGPWGPGGTADQLSCRQNFAILTTDGYWNSNNGFTSIGDSDGTAGARIDPKNPIDANDFYRYNPERPYRDNFGGSGTGSDTLADVAMHYWKRDLRTLPNDVPTSSADPAFWQHMTTFGVSIGLQGRLNPKTDLPRIVNGTANWGNPNDAEDEDRIDDLWHAAVNGKGEFVAAGSPTEFTQGLVNALATVAARLGSASNVTANSTSFQTDTRVYQASYVSGKWSGELSAFEVSSAGISQVDNDGDGLPDPAWRASSRIPATRNILTWSGTTGTAFPTVTQQAQLARTSGLAPVDAANNAAYLKGTRTLEKSRGGTLRDRDSLLGDIVNSSPIYSPDSKAIFVGANDGMLHAFTTVDMPSGGPVAGTELFAYVPKGIDFASMATLSDPQYVHRWFVDGPIAVSSRVQTPGNNFLVGALGRGGRGVYGLNVTNPASFGNANVLWDNTGGSLGNNMGYVLGEPLIVTLNDAASTKAVIVSNGVNSPNGSAVLFVINLATGAVIREIDTNATGDNGLSAPRGADLNTDGKVDYIYAGDRLGNLWKFDLSSPSTAAWGVANSGSPMFIAQDGSGTRQPITSGLGLAKEPITGKVWVVFGTGSLMTAGDITSRTVQTMYGVVDDGTVRRPADLEERQITTATSFAGKLVRAFESFATLPGGKKGWFVDLDTPPNTGERIVSPPRVSGRVMITASLIPPSTNSCEAGGSGYINAIDVFTGTSVQDVFFDANGNRTYSDDTLVVGGVTVPIGSIDLGIGMPTMPTMIDDLLVVGGSSGRLGSVGINPQGGAARREAWHEIVRN
jgi:type IV pilus assembly protein PilY1